MKVRVEDLVIKPVCHGAGLLGGAALRNALPWSGLVGDAVLVGTAYIATQAGGKTVRCLGQGALAGVAAQLLRPFLGQVLGDAAPRADGSV